MPSAVRAGAAIALLATGCAAARPAFTCPAAGGPPWRELASERFVLRTDLDRAGARALLLRLEQLRAAVASVLFESPPAADRRVEIVAFRTTAEYQEFAPPDVDAYYLRYAGGPPRIVLSGQLADRSRALLAHELAHHFLAGVFARQPRWLSEGLATYVESLRGGADPRTVVAGEPPPTRLERVRREPVPVRELFRWSATSGRRPAYPEYASSWLLVHYLASRRRAAFHELQRRLVRGDDPERAWNEVYPEWDVRSAGALEALDAALVAYARGEVGTHLREVPILAAAEPLEQTIPPPEVHAIRLGLWPHRARRDDAALRAEAEETLREAKDHPFALQVLARLDGVDPLPFARASVRSHPDDPRAWTFLATSLRGSPAAAEREDAYRRAAALAPHNAAALHNLARELIDQGRTGEALPIAREAALGAPWSAEILETWAAALSDVGRCAEALGAQRRALDGLPDTATEETRAAVARRLDAYARQCEVRSP